MEMKSAIIHIDGPDKTGKDSIRREVVKATKGQSLVYVRSFLSQIVYSRLYNRKIDEHWFFDKWKLAMQLGEKFFFIDCSYEIIKERFMKHNEQDLDIKDWKTHRRAFYDVLKEAENKGIKIKRIDTTIDKPLVSAKLVIEGK